MFSQTDTYLQNGSKLIRHSSATVSPCTLNYPFGLDPSKLPPIGSLGPWTPNGHHSIKEGPCGHGTLEGHLKTSSVEHILGLAHMTLPYKPKPKLHSWPNLPGSTPCCQFKSVQYSSSQVCANKGTRISA